MIRTFTNVLSQEHCDRLIVEFEVDPQRHQIFQKDGCPNFTQIELPNFHNTSTGKTVLSAVQKMCNAIRDDYPELPEITALETFRIKKYSTGGNDRFDRHVDVTNHETARRALAIQFYLNTVKHDGKTIFFFPDDLPKMIPAIAGNAIAFPPMWMYPHRGEPPTSDDKYILTTYLHYT